MWSFICVSLHLLALAGKVGAQRIFPSTGSDLESFLSKRQSHLERLNYFSRGEETAQKRVRMAGEDWNTDPNLNDAESSLEDTEKQQIISKLYENILPLLDYQDPMGNQPQYFPALKQAIKERFHPLSQYSNYGLWDIFGNPRNKTRIPFTGFARQRPRFELPSNEHNGFMDLFSGGGVPGKPHQDTADFPYGRDKKGQWGGAQRRYDTLLSMLESKLSAAKRMLRKRIELDRKRSKMYDTI